MKLGVIIGSVRQQRTSEKMAKWITATAKLVTDMDVEIIDLREFDLPFFDEPISPQFNPNRAPKGRVKQWLDVLAKQDAFVLVTPEYNRSIPGVLKNALDFVAHELAKKPIAIASHGSSNGAQAVAQLRGILPGLQAITVPAFLGLPSSELQHIDDEGAYDSGSTEVFTGLLKNVLSEIQWYGEALLAARK